MSQPFIGEIRMFAGNFAPQGWSFCNGALIPIDQNDALFNLIGTTYGGDGQTTFALPNLQSRVPVHVGSGFALGQTGGAESVTLTTSQIPAHSHVPLVGTGQQSNNTNMPGNNFLADETLPGSISPQPFVYSTTAPATALAANALGSAGGSQPHDNMIPFLVINFIISLFGVFPSQT
jgi:microcystin-dependent protein